MFEEAGGRVSRSLEIEVAKLSRERYRRARMRLMLRRTTHRALGPLDLDPAELLTGRRTIQ